MVFSQIIKSWRLKPASKKEKNKEKDPIHLSKKECCEEKHVDLLLLGEEGKNTLVLSKILIPSCIIIHYIVEENTFAFIIYKYLVQKKYQNVKLKAALKLMINKGL